MMILLLKQISRVDLFVCDGYYKVTQIIRDLHTQIYDT